MTTASISAAADATSAGRRSRVLRATLWLATLLLEAHMAARIAVDRDRVAAFCLRHHFRRLALFGSVLRDDFRPESDVDVLVEFEPGTVVGYLDMAGLELELGE